MIDAGLKQRFKAHPAVTTALPQLTGDVHAGRMAPSVAARRLLDLFRQKAVRFDEFGPGLSVHRVEDDPKAGIILVDDGVVLVEARPMRATSVHYGGRLAWAADGTLLVATGDGSFGFNAMEMDTAARHKAPVLIVVANNGAWAIEVRDQQETHGRVCGTRLQFADHAAMAKAFGLYAERVERAEDLDAAIARAMANRPALLDVLVTPEAVSSDAKSGLAWVPDYQALAAWDNAERDLRCTPNSKKV